MANRQTLQWLEQHGLHPRVAERLNETADWAAARGVDLVVFGSFARGENRPGSDLDLGLLWRQERDAAVAIKIEDQLDQLPTVRRIDVVDFSRVSPDFRKQALRSVRKL